MAPSAAEWELLSSAERAAVAAALPGEVTGTVLLLESEAFIARLQTMVDDAQRRATEEAQRREEAEQRRDEAEQENVRLRAELERLKR